MNRLTIPALFCATAALAILSHGSAQAGYPADEPKAVCTTTAAAQSHVDMSRTLLAMKNPVTGDVVLFSEPECLADGALAWRKIDVIKAGTSEKLTVAGFNLESDETFFRPEENADRAFSPDGHYFTLFRISTEGCSPLSRDFLKLGGVGEWTSFISTEEDIYASTETFLGWAEGEPHMAIVADPEQPDAAPLLALPASTILSGE